MTILAIIIGGCLVGALITTILWFFCWGRSKSLLGLEEFAFKTRGEVAAALASHIPTLPVDFLKMQEEQEIAGEKPSYMLPCVYSNGSSGETDPLLMLAAIRGLSKETHEATWASEQYRHYLARVFQFQLTEDALDWAYFKVNDPTYMEAALIVMCAAKLGLIGRDFDAAGNCDIPAYDPAAPKMQPIYIIKKGCLGETARLLVDGREAGWVAKCHGELMLCNAYERTLRHWEKEYHAAYVSSRDTRRPAYVSGMQIE